MHDPADMSEKQRGSNHPRETGAGSQEEAEELSQQEVPRIEWDISAVRVSILATHGQSPRKVAWLMANKGGVYCGVEGLHLGGCNHITYHSNGEAYWHYYGRERVHTQLPPIPEISGLVQFYSAGISWRDSFPRTVPEGGRKTILVDIRNKNWLNMNFYLMGEHGEKTLTGITGLGEPLSGATVHIIKETEPRIVIATY